MSDHLIGQIESVGYRLDVLGESISVEGREVRQLATELRNKLSQLRDGEHFTEDAIYQAGIDKLAGTVESELRHQLEVVRDVIRNLR